MQGLRDVIATFDPDTVKPGWEDHATGVAVAHLDYEGEPYPYSARYALQKAILDWESLGYVPKVGLEFEAYVMQQSNDESEHNPKGSWCRWSTPRSMVYGTGPGTDPDGLIDDIMRTADVSGFKIESINAEYDEAQFELTLEYDDALAAADDGFLFRLLAREMALKHGLDMTFLGKPFPGVSGSGLHVNFSLLNESGDGDNALISDTETTLLSELGLSCLAGLCRHHLGMTALCCPTINAYRRLGPGQLNGYWANWGFEHRGAGNRIPDVSGGPGTRIENRLADGSANVHLAVATVLQGARLGVLNGYDCPDPMTEDGFDHVNTHVHSARTLKDALDDLAADGALQEAVGVEVCSNFLVNKHREWDRYIKATGEHIEGDAATAWELQEYLMYH